jgi:hypothetical protein
MALPPSPAAAPPVGAPPPALGAAPPMPMDAPVEEEGEEEEIATICKRPDGTYVLYKGEKPEGDDMAAGAVPGAEPVEPEGQTFDSPQALMRGIMGLLEGATGAEEAFEGGFKGEPASPPAGGPPKPPMGM